MHKRSDSRRAILWDEPNENRWNIDFGPMNSWATRFVVLRYGKLMMQVSVGRLARPERQEEGDVVRSTASIHYTRPMQGSSWSTSLIWGRNHKTLNRRDSNSYLLESVLPLSRKNFVTGRVELVDKDEFGLPAKPSALGRTRWATRATSARFTMCRVGSGQTSRAIRRRMRSSNITATILYR